MFLIAKGKRTFCLPIMQHLGLVIFKSNIAIENTYLKFEQNACF